VDQEEPEEWILRGACRGHPDPDQFFPDRWVEAGPAKEICHGCPVKGECLSYAVTHQIGWGIWGGRTARERAANRRLSGVR
jgi:WhiB family redox-sensing transcriptional regulator